MSGETGAGRTFLLVAGFLGSVIGGYWLGLMVAFVSGIVPPDPPRFPGEYLAAAILAASLLAVLAVLVRQTVRDGSRAALGLLFTSSFAALNVLCTLYLLAPQETLCILPLPDPVETSTGPYWELAASQPLPPECRPAPPPTASPVFWAAMVPAVLVTTLSCSAAVRRSPLLQLAGLSVGGLFALAGLLLSLARALT